MSDEKISALAPAGAIGGTEDIPVVQSSTTLKSSPSAFATYFKSLVNVFSKNQSVSPVNLSSAATVSVDASLSNNFRLDLGTNATLANPTNLTAGMVLNFRVKNTGTFTLAYGSKYKWAGGTAPTLTSGSGKIDFISAVYDSTDDALYCFIAQDLH